MAAIARAVRAKYGQDVWWFKVVGSPYQMSGVPDILCCVHGLLVGIEVKFQRPGESAEAARDKATAQQKNQIHKINRAGGIAGVVLSADEALDLIERGLTHKLKTRERP